MKVICEKKREINTVTSCRNEFCCKKLREAFESDCKGHSTYHSSFKVIDKDNKVRLGIRHNYDGYAQTEIIDYCPFCGAKLEVEKIEIDNTGLDPRLESHVISERKHWWNPKMIQKILSSGVKIR